ncbi:MAG: hypothetical protein V7603_4621 [Micromonosporaceae bacterium]
MKQKILSVALIAAAAVVIPAAHDLPASQPRIVAQVIERAAH